MKEAEVIVTDASVLNVLEMAKDVVGTNYLAERQTQRERERERERKRERERERGGGGQRCTLVINLYGCISSVLQAREVQSGG